MSQFDYKIVEETARELYIRALKILPPDVREALKKASDKETQPTAKEIFQTILRNVEVSDKKEMLICQDTGLPIYMVKVGSQFPFDGARVAAALKEGAKRATLEHPFRGSSTHPVTRVNPQTSVGEGLPIIYWDFVADSDCLDMLMIPKGSGSENMSAMKMFIPADGGALKFQAFTTTSNLGLGGIFVKSSFLLKEGLELFVELALPDAPLPIRSRVAHVVPLDETELTVGMGIEFLDVDAHGRETLLRYFTPLRYETFYDAFVEEFPHLKKAIPLRDVSLVLNLWEEWKVRAEGGPLLTSSGAPPAPSRGGRSSESAPTRVRGRR